MLSLDLEGPKTEVEKAIVELKKTFVVMDVRFPHKVELRGLGLRMARRWS